MAKPDQIPTDLALDIGDEIAPREFVDAVRNFFGYVDEVARAQTDDGSQISWTVQIKEGSILVGVKPDAEVAPARVDAIARSVRHGLEALAQGNVEQAKLTDAAIAHVKNMAQLVRRCDDAFSISFWINRAPIEIKAGLADKIDSSRTRDYSDYGSIEGRLEAIRDADGILKIRVKDILYPKAIDCTVPESLLEQVFLNFRRRVELDGLIHYRASGTPTSIKVDQINFLPDDKDLPSAGDVRGIMAAA